MHRLFVYGTLMDASLVSGSLGRLPRSRPALLRGYRKERHPQGPWPVAVPDPLASIGGTLLDGLTDEELRILDRYEGVERGLYRRVQAKVDAEGATVDAWAYIKS